MKGSIPKGYRRIKWIEVYQHQIVWLHGTKLGEPEAYGPHIVIDIARRKLHSPVGMDFTHYAEDLLIREVDHARTKSE